MPRELCWACKQLKDDVRLCADDRWCRDCEHENDCKSTAARSVDQSTSDAAVAGSSSRGGSTSKAAVVTKQRSAGVKGNSQKTKINVADANENTQSLHIADGHFNGSTSRRKESTSTVAEVAGDVVNPLVPLIVDELLAYVSFYRNNSNTDALRRTVLSFYPPSNICSSKKLLVDKFSTF